MPHRLPEATPHLCDTYWSLGGAFGGEFPAFGVGNKGDVGANPPGAAGGAPGCRLTLHPRQMIALEGKENQVPCCFWWLPAFQHPHPRVLVAEEKSRHISVPKRRPPPELTTEPGPPHRKLQTGVSRAPVVLGVLAPWSVTPRIAGTCSIALLSQQSNAVRLVRAACSLLASAIFELILPERLGTSGAGPVAQPLLYGPATVTYVSLHCDITVTRAVLAVAHGDAGTNRLLPAQAPLCWGEDINVSQVIVEIVES